MTLQSPERRPALSVRPQLILRIVEILLWTSAAVIVPIKMSLLTPPRTLIDFDAFYIVGGMIWRGEVVDAYDFHLLLPEMTAFAQTQSFMPWTYPPLFDIVVAALALIPYVLAFALFVTGALAIWLPAMKRIAGGESWRVLAALFPAVVVCIMAGQNGVLVAGLAALFCLRLEREHWSAGIPLGLMSIKPHLGLAFAVYLVATGRWRMVLSAAATVIGTSAVATLLLGVEVWPALLSAIAQAKVFLASGFYPLYRMVSLYATAFTLGAPASLAILVQGIQALVVLGLVWMVARAGVPVRQSLGVAAIASLMLTPYAYDYDMPLAGVGLALLAGDIARLARAGEGAAIYLLTAVAGVCGVIGYLSLGRDEDVAVSPEDFPPAIGGLCLLVLLGLVTRLVLRDRARSPAPA